jgi:uncharacterized protein YdeI (YjbR/CyaY-like superfamily)
MELEVPEELSAALASDEVAAAEFDRLPVSHRREYTEWIGGAKRAETRARRVTQALERLRNPAPRR